MKRIILLILLLSSLWILYSFYCYKKYLVEIEETHSTLKDTYKSYAFNFIDVTPTSNNDVNFALNWKDYISGTNKKREFLAENGFGVLNDSTLKKTIIYSYGKDKKDNRLSKNTFRSFDSFVENYSFFRYLFYSNIDVPLLEIEHTKIDCQEIFNSQDHNPFAYYQLLNKSVNLWTNEEQKNKFLHLLTKLEKHILSNSISNYSGMQVLVIYKNRKIKLLCDSGISEEKKKDIADQVIKILNENNDFFDYSVFTLRAPTTMVKKQ